MKYAISYLRRWPHNGVPGAPMPVTKKFARPNAPCVMDALRQIHRRERKAGRLAPRFLAVYEVREYVNYKLLARRTTIRPLLLSMREPERT